MVYDVSINASKGFMDIFRLIGDATSGWFSMILMIAIYIIIMITYIKTNNDFAGGMAISGFGIFIVGLLFWLGGVISGFTFGIVISITIIGVVALLFTRE